MKKEMLINVAQSEECRIAIVEDGILEELYVERTSQESYVGNIYKGKIVNIEPSIQAAFIDFGIGRNGFLHVSDVDPVYYKHLLPRHVVEEIEAEQDAQFGTRRRNDRGGGGRDRDRGPRRDRDRDDRPRHEDAPPAHVMTTWLAPDAPPAVAPVHGVAGDEDEGDFGAGVVDGRIGSMNDGAARPAHDTHPVANASGSMHAPPPVPWTPPTAPQEEYDDNGFGAGLDEVVAPEAEVPKREQPRSTPAPAAKPDPVDDDGFGAGIDFDEQPSLFAPGETIVDLVSVENDEEKSNEPKARKPRTARAKKEPKADDAAKPKARRKKKDDGDEPKAMPGAERRTSEDDPEIRPFFEGGLADEFDVNASNDRFAGVPDAADDGSIFAEGVGDEDGEDASVAVPAVVEEEENYDPPPQKSDDDFGGRRRSGRDGGRDDRGPPRRRDDRGGRSDRGPQGRGGPPPRTFGPPPRDKGYPRMPIEQIFKRGQEVIVQVIKEGIGTKGPTLSTYVSIAGRYLVLMPSLGRVGVSRKIEDMDARRRLRQIMNELSPPEGVGFIVRTAAIDRNPTELQNDLGYLLRLWQVIVRRIRKVAAPVEIYRESDMITRTIRDMFTNDVDTIYVDEPDAFQHAAEFLQVVMPKYADRIRLHEGPDTLFAKYRLDEEIVKLNQKRLDLPRGGSLIIEQTEALVSIDVNSGNFRADNNAEETAYQMNMIAAKEIARQLRLRDLGGVIVNDFIDMRSETHRRNVENALTKALERDRAKTKINRISPFGLIEMTRQRMQQSLKKRIFNECGHCRGTGLVKTNETLGIDAMRQMQAAVNRAINSPNPVTSATLNVCAEAAFYLLNKKRKEIAAMEARANMEVTIHGIPGVSPDHLEFKCFDGNGTEVRLVNAGPPPRLALPAGGNRGRDGGRDRDRRHGRSEA